MSDINTVLYQIGKDMKELEIRIKAIEQTISEQTITEGFGKQTEPTRLPLKQQPFEKVVGEPVSKPIKSFPVTALSELKLMSPGSHAYKMLQLIKSNPGICVHKLVDETGCALNTAYVILAQLRVKNLIYITKKSAMCDYSQRRHSGYNIVQPGQVVKEVEPTHPITRITKPGEIILVSKPKGMCLTGRPYKILKLVQQNPGICSHKVASKLDCSLKDAACMLNNMLSKGQISAMKNSITCGESPRVHNGYIISKTGRPVPKPVKAKQKPHGIVTKGSKESKALQIINDNPEICVHGISDMIGETLKKTSKIVCVLKKKGRVQSLDTLKICKFSQKKHPHYKVTIPVTEETFLDMKEEERQLAQDKYDREMEEKTKELDLDSVEPNGDLCLQKHPTDHV